MLRQEIILTFKLKICNKSCNTKKKKRYKMNEHTKTKELYYKIKNAFFIFKAF